MSKKFLQNLDILVLLIAPLAATILTNKFDLNIWWSIALFYGAPALYLSVRNPKAVLRALVFAGITAVPASVATDYMATATHTWYVPALSGIRLLGVSPLEDIVWSFAFIYSIVILYEHFLDKGRHNLLGKKMKYLVAIMMAILILVMLVYYFSFASYAALIFPYFQFGLLFMLIPVILFLSRYPNFLGTYVKIGAYFFLVGILHETTAMRLGHWYFLGNNYLGWVEILSYRFPFEEFFFYIVLGAVAILYYFEYFDDNKFRKELRKK